MPLEGDSVPRGRVRRVRPLAGPLFVLQPAVWLRAFASRLGL